MPASMTASDRRSEGPGATYPDSYKLNVYKSNRTCTYPDFVYKAAKRNAEVGLLVDGGNGISEAIIASPFPIPNNALKLSGTTRCVIAVSGWHVTST